MRRLEQIHGMCKVDDHDVKVKNFRIDPPALFKGRGLHPDRGKLKQRIRPEDVIINVEENVIVEPPNGHSWKDVLHDKTVYWLASWKCLPTRKIKYMTPDASSRFKPSKLNEYLNNMMRGLTCKVFRTFMASKKMEEQLSKNTKEDMSEKKKIIGFKNANAEVAILLNHKKKASPAYQTALDNLQDKYETTEDRLFDLEAEFLRDQENVRRYDRAEDRRALKESEKKLEKTEKKLKEIKEEIKLKKKMKNVALETSKANYIDPRINVAWSKKFGVPLKKIYNKNDRRRFLWAIEMANENFQFIRKN